MEGGALQDGLGYGEEGGIGSTLVWYLRGAGTAATEAWEVATASVEPMAGLPWVATGAATAAGEGTTAAATAGPRLDPPTGGGEEQRTRGLKLCPPCVFTMVGLEKERMGRGGYDHKGI